MAMKGGNLKTILIALAAGAAITGLLYAIEHVNLTGRAPVTLDVAALSPQTARKPLLAGLPDQDFRCEPEKSDLGQTICWAEIESFNGIDARYLAFFFDKQNQLTAFKLAAYAREHADILQRFTERFGQPQQAPDAPFLAWPTGAGVLTTTAKPPEGNEATVLWVDDPQVVKAFRQGGH